MNSFDTLDVFEIKPSCAVRTVLEVLLDTSYQIRLEASSTFQEKPLLALAAFTISSVTEATFGFIILLVVTDVPKQLVI